MRFLCVFAAFVCFRGYTLVVHALDRGGWGEVTVGCAQLRLVTVGTQYLWIRVRT